VARLNDDAQWIVLMGFLVSFSFFFLALVINQSTVVGQTTAESVIEFPKNDIRDTRSVMISSTNLSITNPANFNDVRDDIKKISLNRKSAVVSYSDPYTGIDTRQHMYIYYNNGVTEFYENWTSL